MEIHERLARLEADEKNIFHQLSEIKDEVKDIRRLTNAVEQIALKMESIYTKVDEMGGRITEVEGQPLADFIHLKRVIISAVITSALSTVTVAILALIMKV